jgi:hypothetical protein
MDVAQVTELRSWAARLEELGSSEEMRAAGKAIHMLVDEVESLQAKLVEAEAGAPPAAPAEPPPVTAPAAASTDAPADADDAWKTADERLEGSFYSRVKKSLGFD